MKLWQAILIGCDRRAQAFKSLFVHDKDGKCRSCALGAGFEGTFGITSGDFMSDLESERFTEQYPFIDKNSKCPQCGEEWCVESIITHLNDNHRWTRERIALEFVKPMEEANDQT